MKYLKYFESMEVYIKDFTNVVNKLNKMIFSDIYEKTIKREEFLKTAGYNMITIWESDWNKIKENI